MSIRGAINQNKGVAGVIAVTVILLCAFLLSHTYFAQQDDGTNLMAFYTADDGQTFFRARFSQPEKFDHGGKPSYLAFVFTCKGKGKFVGYIKKGGSVKRPGDTKWVPEMSSEGKQIASPPPCQDGSLATYVCAN